MHVRGFVLAAVAAFSGAIGTGCMGDGATESDGASHVTGSAGTGGRASGSAGNGGTSTTGKGGSSAVGAAGASGAANAPAAAGPSGTAGTPAATTDAGTAGTPAPAATGAAGTPAPADTGAAGTPAPAVTGTAGTPAPAATGTAGTPAPAATGAAGTPAPAATGAAGAPAPAATGTAGAPAPAATGTAGTPAPATTGTAGAPAPAATGTAGAPAATGTAGAPAPAATGTAGAPATTGAAGAAPASTAAATIVPLYTYPTDPSWTTVAAAKTAHPKVRVVAVVNPANGPSTSRTDAYAAGIDKLTAAGVEVVGYVYTQYGARNAAEVQRDMDSWRSFYPKVSGIFFDEQSNQAGHVDYYRGLASYAHGKGFGLTIGNPGTDTSESYIGSGLDVMLIYESNGLPAVDRLAGWHTKYPKTNFGVIPWGANMDTSFVQMARNYVGFIYINNDVLPNPWDSVPPYFEQLVAALE
jgi:hypothetical protein